MPRHRSTRTAIAAALLLPLGAVAAGPPAPPDAAGRVRQQATLYLWGAGINGETAGGADVDIGFDTLIKNLNLAFMGAYEAGRGRWSAGLDLIYLNVGANDSASVPRPTRAGAGRLDASASVETRGWVISPFLGYNLLRTDRVAVDALIGARYLELGLDFDLDLAGGGQRAARGVNVSQISWDAVAGVRGRVQIDRNWFAPWRLDIGTGESDLTWQATAGVGYQFGRADIALTYRHMAWRFGSGESLDHVSLSGPMLSATLAF